MTQTEKSKVEKIMQLLDCTEEEALDVIATDKMIDKGERTPYDLSKEDEKEALKMVRIKDRKAKDVENNQRGKVRAENPTKADLINFLYESLKNYDCKSLNITNKERQIAFSIGETNFELTLVQKRAKKS